jgi:hypothetical protein
MVLGPSRRNEVHPFNLILATIYEHHQQQQMGICITDRVIPHLAEPIFTVLNDD